MNGQLMEQIDLVEVETELLGDIFEHIPTLGELKKIPKKGTIIATTPEIEQGKYCISNYLKHSDFNGIISEFYTKLEENFTHCDLRSFYKNLQTLEVKVRKPGLLTSLSLALTKTMNLGSYNPKTNKLKTMGASEPYINGILCYGLLNMASTKKTKDTTYCGFSQTSISDNHRIGMAINKGYTEHLNSKYFIPDTEMNPSNEMIIAEGLELIVGSRRMEALYFSADLKGLVDELAQYTTREHAITLIKRLDNIAPALQKRQSKEAEYKEIREEIAEIYMEKQRRLLERGIISEETYNDRRIMYAEVLVKENIAVPEGAQLYRENGYLKIVGNTGIITIEDEGYNGTKSPSELTHK